MVIYKELLKTMLNMQCVTNENTCGVNWKSGTTTENRPINWSRYARMELMELIDSSSRYKHWKDLNGPIDWDNLRMEIVDVWHFLMSEALSDYTIEEIVNLNISPLSMLYVPDYGKALERSEYDDIVNHADSLIYYTYDVFSDAEVITLFKKFYKLMELAGMTFEELYNMYVIKNTLHQFRQDHGYKEGTYSKVILGKEDNEHIIEIVNTHDEVLSADEIYKLYERFYNEHKSDS